MTKWSKFRDLRQIDNVWKKVIVNICGCIIKDNPTNDELKEIKPYPGRSWTNIRELLEEEQKKYLLEFIRYFYYKEERIPVQNDFNDNPKYPNYKVYEKVFCSWNKALTEAGLSTQHGGRKKDLRTNEQLLEYPIKFFEENGRAPTITDFVNNPRYPGYSTYIKRFGSWQDALKLVGLDLESMTKNGFLENNRQKARLSEIFVRDNFADKDRTVDLSGENCNSPYDGICPKGLNYDVKSSKFYNERDRWIFGIYNVYKEDIEWYYLLAFNENWTELLHVWRISAIDFLNQIEKRRIYIGMGDNYEYNVDNMRQYEITERFVLLFENWLDHIQKKDNTEILENANTMIRKYIESKIQRYDKRKYDELKACHR